MNQAVTTKNRTGPPNAQARFSFTVNKNQWQKVKDYDKYLASLKFKENHNTNQQNSHWILLIQRNHAGSIFVVNPKFYKEWGEKPTIRTNNHKYKPKSLSS